MHSAGGAKRTAMIHAKMNSWVQVGLISTRAFIMSKDYPTTTWINLARKHNHYYYCYYHLYYYYYNSFSLPTVSSVFPTKGVSERLLVTNKNTCTSPGLQKDTCFKPRPVLGNQTVVSGNAHSTFFLLLDGNG